MGSSSGREGGLPGKVGCAGESEERAGESRRHPWPLAPSDPKIAAAAAGTKQAAAAHTPVWGGWRSGRMRPLKLTGSRASAPSHCSDAGAQQAKRVSGMQRMPVSERQPSTLAALPACLHVPAPACPQINPAWHLPGCPSQPATHPGSPSHTYTSFGACLSSPAPHLV